MLPAMLPISDDSSYDVTTALQGHGPVGLDSKPGGSVALSRPSCRRS